jgi:hypothetical protein
MIAKYFNVATTTKKYALKIRGKNWNTIQMIWVQMSVHMEAKNMHSNGDTSSLVVIFLSKAGLQQARVN